MLMEIIKEVDAGMPGPLISAAFHNTLIEIIIDAARRADRERVALSGGCFQNKYLLESAVARLSHAGFEPLWHQTVPTNDGGISLGQAVVAFERMKRN